MPKVAARAREIGTESAFDVLARARALEAQGRDVLHLEIGEPDARARPAVLAAAIQALEQGDAGYVQAAGLPELRRAIAADVARLRGVPVDPDQVVVTPGGKPVLFYTVLSVLEPGDEVLVPDPGFPIYTTAVRFAGGVPVALPLRPEHGSCLRAADVAERMGPRTRLLILNSPCNPTGAVTAVGELAAIAQLAQERDLWVLSDEIYLQLAHGIPGGVAPSFYAQPGAAQRTVLLDGFSKAHAMTGWRLGYGVFPPALVEPAVRLVVNSVSCTPPFVQRGGLAALSGGQAHVGALRADLAVRVRRLAAGLDALPGLACPVPPGAFYAWVDARGTGISAGELADRLLQEAGVAVLPGTCFGPGGDGYLRLCAGVPARVLDEAVVRIGAFLDGCRSG